MTTAIVNATIVDGTRSKHYAPRAECPASDGISKWASADRPQGLSVPIRDAPSASRG